MISKPFRKAKALPLGLIRVKKFLAFSIAFTAVLVWIYDKMVPFNPGRYGISAQRIYEIAHETVPSSENVPLIEITSLSSKKRLITQNTFENIFNSIKYLLMINIPTVVEIGRAFVAIGAVWLFIAQEMISNYESDISKQRFERIERENFEIENRQNKQQKNETELRKSIGNLREKSDIYKQQLAKIKQENYDIKIKQNNQQKNDALLEERIIALENDIRKLKVKFENS